MANVDVDLRGGQYGGVLSAEEQGYSGFTHYWEVPYTVLSGTGLTGASDTVTVVLMDTPKDWVVLKAVANVVEAFDGEATQALTLQFGTDGDPNAVIEATSVFTAGPIVGGAGGAPATQANAEGAASDVLELLFTNATAGSPSELTAGKVKIWASVLDLNALGGD